MADKRAEASNTSRDDRPRPDRSTPQRSSTRPQTAHDCTELGRRDQKNLRARVQVDGGDIGEIVKRQKTADHQRPHHYPWWKAGAARSAGYVGPLKLSLFIHDQSENRYDEYRTPKASMTMVA